MSGVLSQQMGERTAADFGSRLRAARERRGIEVRQIAAKTKIPVPVLEALERNDVSRLPGGIFSRAFVRSYAVEVGLNPEQTIREFVEAFPHESGVAGHTPSGEIEDNEAVESDRQTASTFLRLVLISAPVAAIVIYLSTVGRRPAADEVPPAATPAASAPAPVKPAPVPAPEPPAVPAAAPAPSANPSSVPTTGSQPASAAAPGGDAVAPAPAADRLIVGLSVKRSCWVSATVDGQKALDRLVEPGDVRTLEVHRELVLTAGDGSAIILTLNGVQARAIGKSGEVATARLTPSNFSSFLANR